MLRTRVLVADDLSSVLSAVAALLSESFDLVGTVSDGRTALETTLDLKPDVVILDISYGQNIRSARCPTHEPHFNRRFMINQAR